MGAKRVLTCAVRVLKAMAAATALAIPVAEVGNFMWPPPPRVHTEREIDNMLACLRDAVAASERTKVYSADARACKVCLDTEAESLAAGMTKNRRVAACTRHPWRIGREVPPATFTRRHAIEQLRHEDYKREAWFSGRKRPIRDGPYDQYMRYETSVPVDWALTEARRTTDPDVLANFGPRHDVYLT